MSKHIPLPARELELRDELLFVFLIYLLGSTSAHVAAESVSPGCPMTALGVLWVSCPGTSAVRSQPKASGSWGICHLKQPLSFLGQGAGIQILQHFKSQGHPSLSLFPFWILFASSIPFSLPKSPFLFPFSSIPIVFLKLFSKWQQPADTHTAQWRGSFRSNDSHAS